MRKWIIPVLVVAVGLSAWIAQGQPGGPGGPGGFGGPGGPMANMAFGTISAVDMEAGVIAVQMGGGGFGGGPGGGQGFSRQVVLTQDTKVLEQQPATADEIAEGLEITVMGVPSSLQANQATIADAGTDLSVGFGMGFGMGRRGQRGGGAGANMPQAMGNATGKVVGVDPVRIDVGNGVIVEMTTTAQTNLTKLVIAPDEALKVGASVMCQGQGQDDGSLVADTVRLMPAMPGRRGN